MMVGVCVGVDGEPGGAFNVGAGVLVVGAGVGVGESEHEGHTRTHEDKLLHHQDHELPQPASMVNSLIAAGNFGQVD